MVTAPAPRSHPLNCLFIDVGGVLFDDTPLLDQLYHYITGALQRRNVVVTHESVLEERERLIATNSPGVYKAVLRKFSPDDETYREVLSEFRQWLEPRQGELNPVLPEVPEALADLAGKYKLAVAANQGAYLRGLLEQRGLLQFFSSITLSGEIGLSKPDPRFFERMLQDAGVKREYSLMVGDSLANDLRPAHTLGFRTVRVVAGGDNVRDDSAYSFVDGTVETLSQLPLLLSSWKSY